MGNRGSKSTLRQAIIYLNISADEISPNDEKFWNQIFTENVTTADCVVKGIAVQEIRMLRDGSPRNFATLAYKMVERLCLATGTLCNTQGQQTAVLNAIKILVRMLPCIFEDPMWRHFFESNSIDLGSDSKDQLRLVYPEKSLDKRNYTAYVPVRPGSRLATSIDDTEYGQIDKRSTQSETISDQPSLLDNDSFVTYGTKNSLTEESSPKSSLMKALILSICDLLFCPEFTVLPHGDNYLGNAVDAPPEDLKSLSTYDYVWEPGVGFDSNVNSTNYYDKNRAELLRALLVCLSATLYETPNNAIKQKNNWMELFVSKENRHALPLFTSLLNVVFGYKPPRPILQLNSILYENNREQLVETSCQLLIAVLDYNIEGDDDERTNSFTEYMSRIHREEDLVFVIKGFIRLLKNNMDQGSLWVSTSALELDQELQVLLWKICNLNKRFIQYLLRSNDVLDIVIPILYHLNENFQKPSRTALIHVGVFNLLLLSGERNFGVRLNKVCSANTLSNLPDFLGSHADLMIIVFHKLIMYGYKINQLYDYLLTILVNVSPYLKSATILACKCLIQLFETFSSTFVVFTEPNYHQLVIFLLEIFNNLIQYQFDGNANLVYLILTKKHLFLNLVNLPTTQKSIDKVLKKLAHRKRIIQANCDDVDHESQAEDNHKGDETTNKLEINDNIQTLDLSLATVSCATGDTNSSNSAMKQEACLVATPDLQHSTLSVHPFEPIKDSSANAGASNFRNSTPTGTKDEGPSISLDDILNETDGSNSLATLTFDAPIDNHSQQRQTLGELMKNTNSLLMIEMDESESKSISISPPKREGSLIDHGSGSETEVTQLQRWRPTSTWLTQWKRTLPLETTHRMICALEPQLEQMKANRGRSSVEEADVIKFLQNGTLVGLLPVPHPIQIRKYKTNEGSTMWLRACTWGVIFVRSTIWTGTDIRLVKIL